MKKPLKDIRFTMRLTRDEDEKLAILTKWGGFSSDAETVRFLIQYADPEAVADARNETQEIFNDFKKSEEK